MDQQFYMAVDGQQTGPFSMEELEAQNPKRGTLVWTEGMENWMKVEEVELLKKILKSAPPPIPPIPPIYNTPIQSISTPPLINSVSSGRFFGYELASKGERLIAAIIESIIFLIPYLIIYGESALYSDEVYSISSIIAGAGISALMGAIFYSLWSGNLGHRILRLKVVSASDGVDQRNPIIGALREFLKNLLGIIIIPIIWLLWDEKNQNLYDKVVNTYVVKMK
jgi:uncharacterized RDD family membrane protein YckC